jgi:hypothetical protein
LQGFDVIHSLLIAYSKIELSRRSQFQHRLRAPLFRDLVPDEALDVNAADLLRSGLSSKNAPLAIGIAVSPTEAVTDALIAESPRSRRVRALPRPLGAQARSSSFSPRSMSFGGATEYRVRNRPVTV